MLVVDADGTVLETTLLPDDPLFGPTVRDALASAKFKAADVEGRPVPYWMILEFVFTMRPVARAIGSPAQRTAVRRYPSVGMWKPGAALPSSGQRVVIALARV